MNLISPKNYTVNKLFVGEDVIILHSFVSAQYRRVTDGQTDSERVGFNVSLDTL